MLSVIICTPTKFNKLFYSFNYNNIPRKLMNCNYCHLPFVNNGFRLRYKMLHQGCRDLICIHCCYKIYGKMDNPVCCLDQVPIQSGRAYVLQHGVYPDNICRIHGSTSVGSCSQEQCKRLLCTFCLTTGYHDCSRS